MKKKLYNQTPNPDENKILDDNEKYVNDPFVKNNNNEKNINNPFVKNNNNENYINNPFAKKNNNEIINSNPGGLNLDSIKKNSEQKNNFAEEWGGSVNFDKLTWAF